METVRRELDHALPYYQWQGRRNYYGRILYLMVLLEEAVRILAVPKRALTEALKADKPATLVLERVSQAIVDLGESPGDVCGVWAEEAAEVVGMTGEC